MNKPAYTRHAGRRMVERGVSEREVEEALADPDITYGDPDGNRRYVRHWNGRKVSVVVKGDGDQNPPLVITVMAD
ncbi:MAG: DUF4258 domain-containing protein [Chloroflexota bacterium]